MIVTKKGNMKCNIETFFWEFSHIYAGHDQIETRGSGSGSLQLFISRHGPRAADRWRARSPQSHSNHLISLFWQSWSLVSWSNPQPRVQTLNGANSDFSDNWERIRKISRIGWGWSVVKASDSRGDKQNSTLPPCPARPDRAGPPNYFN